MITWFGNKSEKMLKRKVVCTSRVKIPWNAETSVKSELRCDVWKEWMSMMVFFLHKKVAKINWMSVLVCKRILTSYGKNNNYNLIEKHWRIFELFKKSIKSPLQSSSYVLIKDINNISLKTGNGYSWDLEFHKVWINEKKWIKEMMI